MRCVQVLAILRDGSTVTAAGTGTFGYAGDGLGAGYAQLSAPQVQYSSATGVHGCGARSLLVVLSYVLSLSRYMMPGVQYAMCITVIALAS
jgi:hypothetical protein